MKNYILFIGMILVLTLFNTSYGNTWYVHPDSTLNTIQTGLDSCSENDTVLVAAGTYFENIIWPNTQGIDLISEYGRDTTIIDGSDIAEVIIMDVGLDSTTIIKGFTITHGDATYAGGINCSSNSSPSIMNNTITENNAAIGGAIHCDQSIPFITDNIISNNTSTAGAGIYCSYLGNAIITNNIITGNINNISIGGGILVIESSPLISYNTITMNTAIEGGGIFCGTNIGVVCAPTIINNTISNNTANEGAGIHCAISSCSPTIDSCIISNNNGDGIFLRDLANPIIHYNNITGNTGYGVINTDSTLTIDATNNWWGNPSGPGGFGPGTGDSVSLYVNYDPWLTNPVSVEETENTKFKIADIKLIVHPNPFTNKVEIRLQIPEITKMENRNFPVSQFPTYLCVYDLDGRLVKKLSLGTWQLALGTDVSWNGRDDRGEEVSGGVYFLKLNTDKYTSTKKLLLVR